MAGARWDCGKGRWLWGGTGTSSVFLFRCPGKGILLDSSLSPQLGLIFFFYYYFFASGKKTATRLRCPYSPPPPHQLVFISRFLFFCIPLPSRIPARQLPSPGPALSPQHFSPFPFSLAWPGSGPQPLGASEPLFSLVRKGRTRAARASSRSLPACRGGVQSMSCAVASQESRTPDRGGASRLHCVPGLLPACRYSSGGFIFLFYFFFLLLLLSS